MKNIISIAALCLVGSQAVKLTAESQVEQCGGCGSQCLQYNTPGVNPCCVPCNPCVCTSADCEFTTGQDKSLMTYAGLTSVKESPFWQIIKENKEGMEAYQKYINAIRHEQEKIDNLQSRIDKLLAELNEKEVTKEANGLAAYKEMLNSLLGLCPVTTVDAAPA